MNNCPRCGSDNRTLTGDAILRNAEYNTRKGLPNQYRYISKIECGNCGVYCEHSIYGEPGDTEEILKAQCDPEVINKWDNDIELYTP